MDPEHEFGEWERPASRVAVQQLSRRTELWIRRLFHKVPNFEKRRNTPLIYVGYW